MRLFKRIITTCFIAASLSAVAIEYAPEINKSKVIVFINGKKYYVHTVKSGDTLYSIAKAYGVTEKPLPDSARASAPAAPALPW